ncbi:MAG TPA: D-lyxose/D-mannose family sugar isomerase [Pyrinomonadaceae bacterium]|jgi:D-lyxose ketol-isomerase
MINQQLYIAAVEGAEALFTKAGIIITPDERKRFEVADFGLEELEKTGLQIITYVNTERCCAKEIAMSPFQTCPEHCHPSTGAVLGKEETFRCRWGTVYLYVKGDVTEKPIARPPSGSEAYYTVGKEICLRPGDQYTIHPDTLHWFQAGPEGAVVSEFSTKSTDESDYFTDPRIKRIPVVNGE